jgi:hypothetical protein
MRISKMSFTATIPTQQYANIQPSIEIEVDRDIPYELRDATELGIGWLKDLYARYSSLGALKEHEVKVETVKDVL